MDLNMIKGLGRSYQQILFKNNISNVEQLIRLLPKKIKFTEIIDINEVKNDGTIAVEGTILTNVDFLNDDMLQFKIKTSNKVLNCNIKKSNYTKKQLLTGKTFKFLGYFECVNDEMEIFNICDINDKNFEIEYNIPEIQSSLIEKFILKGMENLEKYSNELPIYIKNEMNYTDYSDIMKKIHSPVSKEDFNEGLSLYSYELFFNFFVKFYYYIFSTSLQREDNPYDLTRINQLKEEFGIQFTDSIKNKINFLLKECKKSCYNNIIIENLDEDKFLVLLFTIVAKVSTKKQVVIVTKNEYDFYSNYKVILQKYNIKMDIMTKKGKNKDNFENFNSGKFDVLLTSNVNFETLNTNNIGMIIIDDEEFNLNNRSCIKSSNSDTVFITKTNFGTNFDSSLLKNFSILSDGIVDFTEEFLNIFLENNQYESLMKLLGKEEIEKNVKKSAETAYDFIKNKRFKESIENSIYFKNNIES